MIVVQKCELYHDTNEQELFWSINSTDTIFPKSVATFLLDVERGFEMLNNTSELLLAVGTHYFYRRRR